MRTARTSTKAFRARLLGLSLDASCKVRASPAFRRSNLRSFSSPRFVSLHPIFNSLQLCEFSSLAISQHSAELGSWEHRV